MNEGTETPLHNVIAIQKYDPNSWNSVKHMAAVAVDEAAAKRWIQDEVDGKHGQRGYMLGKNADWWIESKYFYLEEVPLHE